jgi:uncharacterized membrane protein
VNWLIHEFLLKESGLFGVDLTFLNFIVFIAVIVIVFYFINKTNKQQVIENEKRALETEERFRSMLEKSEKDNEMLKSIINHKVEIVKNLKKEYSQAVAFYGLYQQEKSISSW